MYIFILCFTEKSKDNKMYKKVINVLPRTNSVVFRDTRHPIPAAVFEVCSVR